MYDPNTSRRRYSWWIDSLRLQAEEAFADPGWSIAFGHRLSVLAADNEPDASRGLAGYVTTYQGDAAAPELHLTEMRRRRTLLVVDEAHRLPGLADHKSGRGFSAAKDAITVTTPCSSASTVGKVGPR